jgi:hydroxymethylpyrimidine pyrophosphatase-like HAD family hydrolase
MRYRVLASDYDGTLAHNGRVDAPIVSALERFIDSGRKIVLVTGRELLDLGEVFPRLDLFEWVVAENGALLYRPATNEEKPLAGPPPAKFVELLQARDVWPLSVGRVIVATWEAHEKTVVDAIHSLGLDLQVILNKGSVMVLPSGVNKATGLSAALKEMRVSPSAVVGVGDAENDHALLSACGFAVAVANALPALKDSADLVTAGDHGAGVAQLIDRIIATDLSEFDTKPRRHSIAIGGDNDPPT